MNKEQAKIKLGKLIGTQYWMKREIEENRPRDWFKPAQLSKIHQKRLKLLIETLENRIELGHYPSKLTEFGSTIESGHVLSDYVHMKGFQSLETYNEPYYTVQYNVEKLTIVTYCEGDVDVITAPDSGTFWREIGSIKQWISQDNEVTK